MLYDITEKIYDTSVGKIWLLCKSEDFISTNYQLIQVLIAIVTKLGHRSQRSTPSTEVSQSQKQLMQTITNYKIYVSFIA